MEKKPNIVIIMADQLRADLRKSEGYPIDTMPFLDSFAKRGVDFQRAYTSMPACAPARVSMLTGRFPCATHVKTNHNIPDAYYYDDLISVLKENGYITALCGKNHSYLKPEDFKYWYEKGPKNHDDRTEIEKKFDKYLKDLRHMTDPNPTNYPLECQRPYRLVTKALDWINTLDNSSDNNKPFFLWLSFVEPHNPYQVPEPYFSMFPPDKLPQLKSDASAIQSKSYKYRWMKALWEDVVPCYEETIDRTRSTYLGMLRLIDDQVKRFIENIERSKVLENTIIIFIADHGDFVGEYKLIRKGPELPEVLCRIPMIFTGPEIIAHDGKHEAHVSIVDIMPTLCDAIGVEVPKGVQGKSLWPILTGAEYPSKEFESAYCEHGFGGLYYDENDSLDPMQEGAVNFTTTVDCLNSWTQSGTMRMIRKGDWKLIYDMEGSGQLYNLKNDPVELTNLFNREEYRDIQAELLADLLVWVLRTQDNLPYPRRRYVMKTNNKNYWCSQ